MNRVVVAGGAGFVGSHMCDYLLSRGDEVVCVDNFATGSADNVAHLGDHERFTLVDQDISAGLAVDGDVSIVMNLASPASPKDYYALPIETLDVGSLGTRNCIELAMAKDARMLMASTSEVYGDPQVHPQTEDYWGHVNPVGPRSCYDEAKRFSEALISTFERERGLNAGIARIFNTYGPRMKADDGRVMSNFIVQALQGIPLTVYGEGNQTRSFCFVEDQVRGLTALADSDLHGPTNIGNPHEVTVLQLAETIIEMTGAGSEIVFEDLPQDDPMQRKPDVTRATTELGWEPKVQLAEGIERTVAYFRQVTGT